MRCLLGAVLLALCAATAHATVELNIQVNKPSSSVSAQFAAPSKLAGLITGPVKQQAAAASAFFNRRMLQLQSAAAKRIDLDALEVMTASSRSRGAAIEVPKQQRGRSTPGQPQPQQPKIEINPPDEQQRPASSRRGDFRSPIAAAAPATTARTHTHRDRPAAPGAHPATKPAADAPAAAARDTPAAAAVRSSKDKPAAAAIPPASNTAKPASAAKQQPANAPTATFVRSFVSPAAAAALKPSTVSTAAVATAAVATAAIPAPAPAAEPALAPAAVVTPEEPEKEPNTQAPAIAIAPAVTATAAVTPAAPAAIPKPTAAAVIPAVTPAVTLAAVTPASDAAAPAAVQPAACATTVAAWSACGGAGDPCSAALRAAGKCTDAPWQGHCCGANAACIRVNEWYWHCAESSSSAPVTSSTPAQAPEAASTTAAAAAAAGNVVTAGAWQSCGGAGNTCPQALVDAGKCKDAQWEGYRCAEGLSCVREHQWFWSCRPTSRH
uniref:CBM1 domain-containing protein n=1 Tax=Tetradesmus obliquus TaxID=3088 RepID=A0A383W7J9_TETOB|eukprot:jgi/Sobl393_1/6063/SZX72964.1